jgi:Salmonella virulence plasmid 65kDa B protein/FG-GAP-like repeat
MWPNSMKKVEVWQPEQYLELCGGRISAIRRRGDETRPLISPSRSSAPRNIDDRQQFSPARSVMPGEAGGMCPAGGERPRAGSGRSWSVHSSRRSWGPRWRIVLLAFLMMGLCLWWTSADRSPAWAGVGGTGSFTTQVPIEVPSFHGIQPDLALQYSSQGGNGWVGIGWSLTGTSMIDRTAGAHGLPHWDASDHFTIDGVGLIPCAGGTPRVQTSPSCAHPVAGTNGYTSQIETYQRIVFTPSNAGGYWTVWHTNGVKVTYLPVTTVSGQVLDWRTSSVQDPSGNTVTYHWSGEPDQQAQLANVTYGDTRISFLSGTRPDPITVADGGGLLTDSTRLTGIEETAAGAPVRSYRLDYKAGEGGSGESFLSSVQQFGSDGVTSFPAATFDTDTDTTTSDWQARNTVLPAFSAAWPSGPADGSRWGQTLSGGEQGSLTWSTASEDARWLSADVNNDERNDVLRVQSDGLDIDVNTELNRDTGGYLNTRSLLHFPWPTDDHPAQGTTEDQQTRHEVTDADVQFADVNGDGFPDLVIVVHESDQTLTGVAVNQQDGRFTPSTAPLTVMPVGDVLAGDVTGDGDTDLVEQRTGDSGQSGAHDSCGQVPSLTTFIGSGTGTFTSGPTTCWPDSTGGGRPDRRRTPADGPQR